ncbi:MAG TPA: Holliday junction resolvase RuvX [Phycisphaerales bacterium]|nr:Holliday junction resolvase RuvX [Phycisphaerales bacterium]
MRYLGIDYGDRRTGLAVCDAGGRIVSPLAVLPSDGALVDRIAGIIAQEGIEALVLGLPLNMDDTEGPQARKVRRFAEALGAKVSIPICFQDERLSSFEAADRLADLSLTRKGRKKRLDAVAAAGILQAFLAREAGEEGSSSSSDTPGTR